MIADEQDAAAEPAAGPVGRLASISLDCPDPAALAEFYGALLGMRPIYRRPDGSVIALSDGTAVVTMMRVENYVPPSWPEPGQLQQMHLDISVTDLAGAIPKAIGLGAREAGHQPSPELFRVLIDPAGHPFCLTTATAG